MTAPSLISCDLSLTTEGSPSTYVVMRRQTAVMDQAAISPGRARVLSYVADAVYDLRLVKRATLVAVDGVDGSGKSIFADQLARRMGCAGQHVVRASADDFHRPRAERYRRGRTSPLGFWLDSYDYSQLRKVLRDPCPHATRDAIGRRSTTSPLTRRSPRPGKTGHHLAC